MQENTPSKTPETDAARYPMNGIDVVFPEHAEKLELQRNELLEALKSYVEWDKTVRSTGRTLPGMDARLRESQAAIASVEGGGE